MFQHSYGEAYSSALIGPGSILHGNLQFPAGMQFTTKHMGPDYRALKPEKLLACLFDLVLYVHGTQLRSIVITARSVTLPHCSWASLPEALYQHIHDIVPILSPVTDI